MSYLFGSKKYINVRRYRRNSMKIEAMEDGKHTMNLYKVKRMQKCTNVRGC